MSNPIFNEKEETSTSKVEGDYPFTKTNVSQEEFISKANYLRNDFLKINRKGAALTYSVFGIIIALVITTLILMGVLPEKYRLYTIIPFGLGFILLIIYIILNKKMNISYTDVGIEYQNNYAELLADYTLTKIDNVSTYSFMYNGQIADSEIYELEYFEQFLKSVSRNELIFDVNDVPLKQIDCAIGIPPIQNEVDKLILSTAPKKSKNEPSFVAGLYGRVYSYKVKNILSSNADDKVVISITSDKTYTPTNLKNIKRYESKEFDLKNEIYVYGSNKEVIKKALDLITVDKLNSIEIDDTFFGGFITITSNGIFFGFSFNEASLELPIKKQVNITQINRLNSITNLVVSICSSIKVEEKESK